MHSGYQQETFHLETDHWWYRARREIILAEFQRRYPSRRDLNILDVGCGAGTLLRSLSRFGRVTGLEVSPEAAEEARRRSSACVWTGVFPDGIPSDHEPFDAACLFDVIEHIDDDVSALRRARELLRPRGTLFVTVPALPWIFGIHDEINEHHRRYTRSTLTAAFSAAGFRRVWVSYFNALLSPLLIPAICWRNLCRSGHHFELRTRLAPLLERVFALERHLMKHVRLPFGLSLLAVAENALPDPERGCGLTPTHNANAADTTRIRFPVEPSCTECGVAIHPRRCAAHRG